MKLGLSTFMPCVVVTRNSKEYNSNGNKGVTYTLGIVSEGQVAEIPCSQMAYDKVGELGQYSEVVLFGDYDTNYKNFKVLMVEAVNKK